MNFLGKSKREHFLSAMGASLLLFGCGESVGSGTFGELSAGTFEYVCVAEGDAVCSETGAIDSFVVSQDFGRNRSIPDAVATASLFGLSFEGDGFDSHIDRIIAAYDDDEISSGQFSIAQPTEAAFLAMEGFDQVQDFTVITAREARSLQLWAHEEVVENVKLTVGDVLALTVVPVDESERLLAGALPYHWQSMNDEMVSIGSLSSSTMGATLRNRGDIVISALHSGITYVRVASGKLGAELRVEVEP